MITINLSRKIKRMLRYLWIGLCGWYLMGGNPPVFAGAWVQPQGHYYSKISMIYSDAEGVYESSSDALFTDYSIYAYVEYGLFRQTNIVMSMPVYKRSVNEADFIRGTTNGYLAGDLEILAKREILTGPVVVSVAAGAKLPIGYDIFSIPPLGNGETDWDARVLAGMSLYPIPAYITADAGYRFRGGEFVDEYHYNFEVGYTFWDRYLVQGLVMGISSVEETLRESNLFGFPLAQDKLRVGGGLIYIINTNLEVNVTYLDTVSGTFIPKAQEIFIGIALKG